jgi:hypothetical protein
MICSGRVSEGIGMADFIKDRDRRIDNFYERRDRPGKFHIDRKWLVISGKVALWTLLIMAIILWEFIAVLIGITFLVLGPSIGGFALMFLPYTIYRKWKDKEEKRAMSRNFEQYYPAEPQAEEPVIGVEEFMAKWDYFDNTENMQKLTTWRGVEPEPSGTF